MDSVYFNKLCICYLFIAYFIFIVSNQKTSLSSRWKVNKEEGILGFDYIVSL